MTFSAQEESKPMPSTEDDAQPSAPTPGAALIRKLIFSGFRACWKVTDHPLNPGGGRVYAEADVPSDSRRELPSFGQANWQGTERLLFTLQLAGSTSWGVACWWVVPVPATEDKPAKVCAYMAPMAFCGETFPEESEGPP